MRLIFFICRPKPADTKVEGGAGDNNNEGDAGDNNDEGDAGDGKEDDKVYSA
jgi:hypothetical protein